MSIATDKALVVPRSGDNPSGPIVGFVAGLAQLFTGGCCRLLTRASFRASLTWLSPLRGFRRLLCPRSRKPPRPRHLPDSRIPRQDEVAGAQRRFLEIRRIGRKNLPARHLLTKQPNGAHVREFPPQTLVVFLGGGQPDSVVFRHVAPLAENKDNLVLNVDREVT